MEITIAIVTRNKASKLKKCLTYLTKQSKKNFSVLVVDNNSSDDTRNVVDSFKEKLRIRYCFEEKIGIPYARNNALQKVKRGILAFIDDDCTVFSNFVKNTVREHKKNPEVLAIQGRFDFLPEHNLRAIIDNFIIKNGIENNLLSKDTKRSNNKLHNKEQNILTLVTKNVSFKLSILNKYDLSFDTTFINHTEDIDFAKQIMSLNEQIVYVKSIQVNVWENTNLFAHIQRRFIAGRGRYNLMNKWPKDYFPDRNFLWFFRRLFLFISLSLKNYPFRSLLLIVLFLIQDMSFLFGNLYEKFNH